MSISKQHFEMYARIIRIAREHGVWDDVPDGLAETIEMVCVECESANPRFDRARFLKACEEQEDHRPQKKTPTLLKITKLKPMRPWNE